MLIDWWTVGAQLLNFVILLVALRYLLFDRIVSAMDEREERIASRERRAAEAEEEAEEAARRHEEVTARLEREKGEVLAEARREADGRRQELLEEARTEVEEREDRWRRSLRDRQERLVEHLARTAGEQAIDVARRALTDLGDVDLEERVLDRFVNRLDRLGDDERQPMAEALSEADVVEVRTAFEVPDAARKGLADALAELATDGIGELRWDRDPQLVTGVLVEAGARTVGWSVDGYLDGVRRAFEAVLDEATVGVRDAEDEGDEEGDG